MSTDPRPEPDGFRHRRHGAADPRSARFEPRDAWRQVWEPPGHGYAWRAGEDDRADWVAARVADTRELAAAREAARRSAAG